MSSINLVSCGIASQTRSNSHVVLTNKLCWGASFGQQCVILAFGFICLSGEVAATSTSHSDGLRSCGTTGCHEYMTWRNMQLGVYNHFVSSRPSTGMELGQSSRCWWDHVSLSFATEYDVTNTSSLHRRRNPNGRSRLPGPKSATVYRWVCPKDMPYVLY